MLPSFLLVLTTLATLHLASSWQEKFQSPNDYVLKIDQKPDALTISMIAGIIDVNNFTDYDLNFDNRHLIVGYTNQSVTPRIQFHIDDPDLLKTCFNSTFCLCYRDAFGRNLNKRRYDEPKDYGNCGSMQSRICFKILAPDYRLSFNNEVSNPVRVTPAVDGIHLQIEFPTTHNTRTQLDLSPTQIVDSKYYHKLEGNAYTADFQYNFTYLAGDLINNYTTIRVLPFQSYNPACSSIKWRFPDGILLHPDKLIADKDIVATTDNVTFVASQKRPKKVITKRVIKKADKPPAAKSSARIYFEVYSMIIYAAFIIIYRAF